MTIRNQWLDRFREHFAAVAPESFRALLSLDAAAPGLLTSITYQALFQLTGERDDDGPEGDAVDEQSLTDAEPCSVARPGLDSFVESLNRRGVKTLVLDEAHHLRRAWWKALDALCAAMPGLTIISLTATPPYDVPPQEWLRYQQLCGPVDAEIPVPELVRAGDLCPHQDIVWYTRPAREECELSENFYAARAAYLRRLHEAGRARSQCVCGSGTDHVLFGNDGVSARGGQRAAGRTFAADRAARQRCAFCFV